MQKSYTFFFGIVVLLLVSGNIGAQQLGNRFKQFDKNNDGKLTQDEWPSQARKVLERMDDDNDGTLTSAEFAAFLKGRNGTAGPAEKRTERTRPAHAAAPTHADVSYGDHTKQAFDIWLAKSKDGRPAPLVIYIHGGGFSGGDKNANGQPVQDYLDQGISFASMNYRLSDVGPYPIMMNDAARGLQFIRSKAKQWNLNPDRVACYGGSAGAGISLWLGMHDDLADPNSDDPIMPDWA